MTTGAEFAARLLREAGAHLDPGLSERELRSIERKYKFEFDSDHRELLALVYPTARGWPDWRSGSEADIRRRLDFPVEGVVWDVSHNSFWPKSWGRRPASDAAAERIARRKLKRVPRLIPLYGQRFMAAGSKTGGAPVFSVIQADVVYLGDNLPSYVARELGVQKRYENGVRHHIPFWSELAEGNPDYLDWPHADSRSFRNIGIDGNPVFPPKLGATEPVSWKFFQVDSREEAEEVARREGTTLPDD